MTGPTSPQCLTENSHGHPHTTRHSRESGEPGSRDPSAGPGPPLSAGVTTSTWWPRIIFGQTLSRKHTIPVRRRSLDLDMRNPPPVDVVAGREMARRGEQAVIGEAQRRRPILSPVSPQQRRIPVDELRLLDLFRGSVYIPPAWLLPLTQRGRSRSIPDRRCAQPSPRHRLFYLFYQVEIRYRQLPSK